MLARRYNHALIVWADSSIESRRSLLLLAHRVSFLVAVLDSSILSLPEIADLLVIWMVVQHQEPARAVRLERHYRIDRGCLALYYIGRRGGDALVRKRFNPDSVDRTLSAFRRYG